MKCLCESKWISFSSTKVERADWNPWSIPLWLWEHSRWTVDYYVYCLFRCFGGIFHVILLALPSLYTKYYYSDHCAFIASVVGFVLDNVALRLVSVQVIWFYPVRNIPSVPHKYSFLYRRGYTLIILPTNCTFENLHAKIWCVMDLLFKINVVNGRVRAQLNFGRKTFIGWTTCFGPNAGPSSGLEEISYEETM
jgi:hypothetical protein